MSARDRAAPAPPAAESPLQPAPPPEGPTADPVARPAPPRRPATDVLRAAARNARALLSGVRLGAPYRAPYEVVSAHPTYALRRYLRAEGEGRAATGAPVLFVPPLMVTAEIYDIAPELSAVAFLASRGVDTWAVDFGAPEHTDGGLDRTLDDHVLAIDAAIDRVSRETGRPVHLIGYSQGGMFCYQAAAYRRSAAVASVITLGAPVDMRRNLPLRLHDTLVARGAAVARRALDAPLRGLAAVPGALSSRGFKLFAPRQELKHRLAVLASLHDRAALAALEPKRRFLGGEGFVAWPGPAFRAFVDEFVVDNRMKHGGFVIGGRTVSLSALSAPILYFVGTRDDLARPEAVHAIRRVAAEAPIHAVELPVGHFGLAVGSVALERTWPAVVAWLDWVDAGRAGAPPLQLSAEPAAASPAGSPAAAPPTSGSRAREGLREAWDRLGRWALGASAALGAARADLPRALRLARLAEHHRVSLAGLLAEQAGARGSAHGCLWRGRAWTWAEVEARVGAAATAMSARGVRRGHRVAVLAGHHPEALTLLLALNRVGAVAVLPPGGLPPDVLGAALRAAEVDEVLVDPARAAGAREAFGAAVWVWHGFEAAGGPAAPRRTAPRDPRHEPPVRSAPAGGGTPGSAGAGGRAGDAALVLFEASGEALRPVTLTNAQCLAAAYGAASRLALRPRDTVLLALPLDRPASVLALAGGVVASGARLVLSSPADGPALWHDVRDAGVTVVGCDLAQLEALASAAAEPPWGRAHPLRGVVVEGGLQAPLRAALALLGVSELLETSELLAWP